MQKLLLIIGFILLFSFPTIASGPKCHQEFFKQYVRYAPLSPSIQKIGLSIEKLTLIPADFFYDLPLHRLKLIEQNLQTVISTHDHNLSELIKLPRLEAIAFIRSLWSEWPIIPENPQKLVELASKASNGYLVSNIKLRGPQRILRGHELEQWLQTNPDPKDIEAYRRLIISNENFQANLSTLLKERGQEIQKNSTYSVINVTAERKKWDSEKEVEMFDENTRKQYRIHIKNGKFYDEQDHLVDTREMKSHHSGRNLAIFVMDESGQFYLAQHSLGKIHHSSFLAGNPVAAAGELMIIEGELRNISDSSGHYLPSLFLTLQALEELRKQGVSLTVIWTKFIAE